MPRPSQRAQILEDAAKLGVKAASDKHGVSRPEVWLLGQRLLST